MICQATNQIGINIPQVLNLALQGPPVIVNQLVAISIPDIISALYGSEGFPRTNFHQNHSIDGSGKDFSVFSLCQALDHGLVPGEVQ